MRSVFTKFNLSDTLRMFPFLSPGSTLICFKSDRNIRTKGCKLRERLSYTEKQSMEPGTYHLQDAGHALPVGFHDVVAAVHHALVALGEGMKPFKHGVNIVAVLIDPKLHEM